MKKLKSIAVLSLMAAMVLSSCGEETISKPSQPSNNNTVVKAAITSDVTWTADKVYQLSGRIVVESGATLTIEPGTIIKAEGGREANASVLIVARGGMINANGTAAEPIIFTSVLDEIQPGETVSPNLDESFTGLWGGVIILGNAPVSAKDGDTETQIEGIPANDTRGLYGGSVANDNSGILNYLSIRHGGTLIGESNEINGLTLGGVGSATTVSNIEIVANLDDGIEFFGGTVNVTNALVWAQGDDAFDVDQAYSGTISNVMFIGGSASDHALEIDGPEGTLKAGFSLQNATMMGWNDGGVDGGEYADFRDGAMGTISNVYWANFSQDSDVELDDDVTSANYLAGKLTFSNWEFNVDHLSTGNITAADIFADKSATGGALTDLSFASMVTGNGTTGADASVFAWTWAKSEGQF